MTTTPDTLAKLAAELAQLASEGPALIHLQSGAYICRKLGEAASALAAQALPAAEPAHWRALLCDRQQPMRTEEMHVFGFKSKEAADAWVAEQLDFCGWEYTLEALYAAPQAAHQAAQATAGWQPIGLAPKDGTNIWAFNGEQGVMHWIDVDVTALWVWEDDLLSDADPEPIQPTHWQPLPAPPAALPQPQPQSAQAKGDAA